MTRTVYTLIRSEGVADDAHPAHDKFHGVCDPSLEHGAAARPAAGHAEDGRVEDGNKSWIPVDGLPDSRQDLRLRLAVWSLRKSLAEEDQDLVRRRRRQSRSLRRHAVSSRTRLGESLSAYSLSPLFCCVLPFVHPIPSVVLVDG